MSADEVLYEDKIRVTTWQKSMPFIILGFILMFAVYFLMPFPVESVYDPIINVIFSIAIGLVLVLLGVYFHFAYRNLRFTITEKEIILEHGREKKIIPINEASLKRRMRLTFGERLKLTSENIEKVLFATIRDNDFIEVYRNGILTAVITPADIEDFITTFKSLSSNFQN
ncbi:MAG: hypothetical protein ACTSYQ_03155 [Candidatus Odinarchaeia archaeon]